MYDPVTARFLQEDDPQYGNASDPLSLDLYTYCHNDPIAYSDPSGHIQAGDQKYNDTDLAKIIALTNAWNAAKTKEDKQKISDEATAIRNNANKEIADKNYQTVDTIVTLDNRAALNKSLTTSLADNKLTTSEWNQTLNTVNAKITTDKDGVKTSFGVTQKKPNGRAEIDVSINKDKDTNKVNPVDTSIQTHYSAYIYYMSPTGLPSEADRSTFATNDKNAMIAAGMSEDDIKMVCVNSNDDFKEAWNSMGSDDDIKYVTMDSHATSAKGHEGIGFCIKDPIDFGPDDISKLENKNIGTLYMYGCNAGSVSDDNNVARAFAKKVKGGKVIASDGTVTPGRFGYVSQRDDTYYHEVGANQPNVGWVEYQDIGGNVKRVDNGKLGRNLKYGNMFK